MDIGHNRDGRAGTDGFQRTGGFHIRNCAAHDITAGIGQRADLFEGRRGVPRVGIGHGLYCNSGAAAHCNRADVDLSCLLCHFSVFLPKRLQQAHDVLPCNV